MPTTDPSTLILIPTQYELSILQRCESFQQLVRCPIEICGFGMVVSAARTSQLIARYQPDSVMLLGIAGGLSDEMEVGSACRFDNVVSYGIGVGSGERFRTADQAGWLQWAEEDSGKDIGDTIALSDVVESKQLMTCTAASDGQSDVSERRQVYPTALAEDMEGFSVAAACQLAGVKLKIVRGISNVAGDREKSNWQVDLALQSALTLALRLADGE